MLIAEPQFGQNRVSAKGRVGKSLGKQQKNGAENMSNINRMILNLT